MAKRKLKAIASSGDAKLIIGDISLDCYVLNNEARVISGRGMQKTLGFSSASSGLALTNLVHKKLLDYLPEETIKLIENPYEFERIGAGGSAPYTYGFDATVLIDIADALIQAKKEKKLSPTQERYAFNAEVIIRSVAKVGIVALIDEATGYQKQRDEYQRLLGRYIAEDLRPWLKTFEDNYYREIYKLMGWDWSLYLKGIWKNHPQIVGKITNDIVYNKLPRGVLDELKRLNPKDEKGNRKHKHFQFLSENVGYRELLQHLGKLSVIFTMYGKGEYKKAKAHIDSLLPDHREGVQLPLDMPVSPEQLQNKKLSKFNINLKKAMNHNPQN